MGNVIHTVDLTTANGTHYRVEITPDDFADTPWGSSNRYRELSDWTTRDKKAGELILCSYLENKRFYNFQGAIKIAKRDGWGCSALTGTETKGEQAVKAVMADFEYLKAWCDGDWYYVTLRVVLLDPNGAELDDYEQYLDGIEYGIDDYWQQEAKSMAEELERALEAAKSAEQTSALHSIKDDALFAEGVI